MLCVIGARVAVRVWRTAGGSRGRLLRSDARKQERDDDDALDRDLHTGGPSNPRGSPAGLAAGGYSVPGIGGSVAGLNALELRKMNCEGTTSSSHDFHVLATFVGVHRRETF